jgi:hypothetical protein
VQIAAEPFQTNLPAAASDLVGRTTAVRHLRDLLSAYRLVTLTTRWDSARNQQAGG